MSVEIGVGSSSQADVWTAGRQAAEQAVEHLGGRRPDLTLVFSSARFADARLLAGVRAVTSRAPLVGCSDAGGITAAGPCRRSVTVIGLIAPAGRFVTGYARRLSEGCLQAGEKLGTMLLKSG